MTNVRKIADCNAFLEAVRCHGDPGEAEIERLAALWPAAHAAALAAMDAMPPIGLLSLRRREQAFLTVAEVLDARVDATALTQEQAQLALTILRMGSRRYRKAEAAFVARLGRREPAALESLPETARHYLHALNALRYKAATVPVGR